MIILNEKEYVLNMLAQENIEPSKIHSFLYLYARYLYQVKNLRKAGIIRELDEFMREREPNYNPVDWAARLEKYAEVSGKYPLCQCHGIWVTAGELHRIKEIGDKVLERLAFTLLCLARFGNFRNPDNHNWVSYSNGEIYSMACINTTALEKDLKLTRLRELGLIEYAKKINNLGVQVLFMEESGEKELFLSDFRTLGYEWRVYQGENYIRCDGCGILTRKRKGTSKYCSACRKQSDLEKTRQRVARHREKRNASQKNKSGRKPA